MSALGAVEGAIKTLEQDLTSDKLSPVTTDIKVFQAAFSATKKFAEDLKAGNATPEQGLDVADQWLKALAVFYPPAAAFEPYVEAAEVVMQVADDLGLVKSDPGKPLGKDGVNPYSGAPIGV